MRFSLLCLAFAAILTSYGQTNHFVEVRSNVFDPAELTIAVGDTVTWDNVQGVHNVNGSLATYPNNPAGFDNGGATGPTGSGWPYEFIFTVPGEYDYQCDPHVGLGMVGKITVVSAPSVIISEIMYNPPESGQDSLEFIELYNVGSETVDLEGYSFTQGVVYTFPSFALAPGEFVVVAVDSVAFENNFGVAAFQWASGGLSNGGETITIADAGGNPVNSVTYDDGPPWPGAAADGGGASLGLCDLNADNTDAANWATSTNDTGIEINGNTLLGDPGAATSCAEPVPTISFTTGAFGVDEGDGTAQVRILVQNAAGMTISGELTLDASSTATEEVDFDLGGPTFPQTFNFTATDNLDTVFFDINIVDDLDVEEDETIVLNLSNPSMGVTVGEPDQLRIFINNNDFDTNILPVNEVDSIDANGVATRIGDLVSVRGVVYGTDLRGNGLLFTLIDANNDGIAIFSSSDDFGYTVQEGDEIIVTGEVGQFRGLTQIVADAIEFVDADNTLFDPTVVTALGEDTESQLISFSDLTFVDPTQFDGASAAFNVDVVSPAMDTFVLRFYFDPVIDVPAGQELAGISLIGIGGQFDSSEPLLDGYQISPRYPEDITFNFAVATEEPVWGSEVELYPNPVRSFLRIETPVLIDQALLIGTDGRVLRNWQPEADQMTIPTANLPAGVYYLRLFGEGRWLTRKVLKH
jgi:plastocyanin